MSRHFDNDLIERIKEANDIVAVISEHVALKKKGKNYWGCCPFHNEKTPSFSVTPEKGFFLLLWMSRFRKCHKLSNAIRKSHLSGGVRTAGSKGQYSLANSGTEC